MYAVHGAPAMPQNFNIYNHIATEIFAAPDLNNVESYSVWEQLRHMLHEIVIYNLRTIALLFSCNYFVV